MDEPIDRGDCCVWCDLEKHNQEEESEIDE